MAPPPPSQRYAPALRVPVADFVVASTGSHLLASAGTLLPCPPWLVQFSCPQNVTATPDLSCFWRVLFCVQLVLSGVVALVTGFACAVLSMLQLYDTRLVMDASKWSATMDALCVFATTAVCNSILGTMVLPLGWAVIMETIHIPIGVEVVYFALASPALTALLFYVANMEA